MAEQEKSDFEQELDGVLNLGVEEPVADPVDDTPVDEPVVEDDPEVGDPVDDSVDDLPADDAPADDPIVDDLPVDESVDDEKDELTLLREQNELLLKRIEEGAVAPVAPMAEPAAADQEKAASVSFLSEDDDVDAILSNRDKLNEFANRIYQRAVSDGGTSTRESVMRLIPPLMVEQVQKQLVLREGIKEFFGANEDLAGAKRTVGTFMNEVVAEHPEWKLNEVMDEAAVRTRTVLGIKKRVTAKGGDRKPAFVSKGGDGRRPNVDARTGLQKEIDDLL